jgi:DNA polymerase-1
LKRSLPTRTAAPLAHFFASAPAAQGFAASSLQAQSCAGAPTAEGVPAPTAAPALDNAVTKASYYGGDEALRAKVTMVRTRDEAAVAVRALYAATQAGAVHACDTEVMDIDLKEVGPVGHGHVTCVSVFSGPLVDYGDGPGKALWVDNLDDAAGVLQALKAWFEDESQPKVWHNYGFDRHVMYNEGIDCRGFAGDTMHMARLADSSRDKATGGGAGYSLEALTHDLVGRRKTPMKELFGVGHALKDGSESRLKVLPAIEALQRGTVHAWHRNSFVEYSAFDAEGTWLLHEALAKQLVKMPWVARTGDAAVAAAERGLPPYHTLQEYNDLVMVPFGETLTDMERRGIKVDAHDYLAKVQVREKRALLGVAVPPLGLESEGCAAVLCGGRGETGRSLRAAAFEANA